MFDDEARELLTNAAANYRAMTDEAQLDPMRTDRNAVKRDQAEAVAHRAAQEAGGMFLRAFEVANLRYQLQRLEAGATGADGALAGFVGSLLHQRGGGPLELRVAHSFERPMTVREVDEHPSAACSQCGGPSRGGPSMDCGGGYRECRRCGHGWLNVSPDDVAL